jgi:hypothetical protein
MVSDGFDGGLAEARQELQQLADAAAHLDREPPEGHGKAADGRVRVTAAGVDLDPRAMRLPSTDLAAAIMEASNAALDDLAAKYPAMAYPTVDLATLDAQLGEVQQQGLMQLRRYTQSISDAVRRIG